MTPFGFALPGRVIFGRGAAEQAPGLIRAFGTRGILVHGASPARAAPLLAALCPGVLALSCPGEPTLPMLDAALAEARSFAPEWIVATGGGAAIDMGKALAGFCRK